MAKNSLGRLKIAGPRRKYESLEIESASPTSEQRNRIQVWKFGENHAFTTVPNTLSVSFCARRLQKQLGHKRGGLDLWNQNRGIILDKSKSLMDYPGLTKLHVIRRPRSRVPHWLHVTSLPDMIDPDEDDGRVRMTCGHAITPQKLYNYAWSRVSSGSTDITCPAILNSNNEHCSEPWNFKDVSQRAHLSEDERNLFLTQLFSNWLVKNTNVYLCPQCGEAQVDTCHRPFIKCQFCLYSFCCKCFGSLRKIRRHVVCGNDECQASERRARALLLKCRMRKIVGVSNCPSVRACPLCHCLIKYGEDGRCKFMTCSNTACRVEFCFICLSMKTGYYWPCGGAYDECDPAPRQKK